MKMEDKIEEGTRRSSTTKERGHNESSVHEEEVSTRRADDDGKSPFLTTEEAAEYVRLTPQTLMRMRVTGGGPVFRYHAGNVVYHIDDLISWSTARSARRTSRKKRRVYERRRPVLSKPKSKPH